MSDYVSSADGTRIGYDVLGSGPPLLMVHGAGADRTQWDAIKPALAERFTVYVMDRRGRGQSLPEAAPYSLDREAEDIAAVVEATGGRPGVFAHSFGGLATLVGALQGVDFSAMLIDEAPSGRPDGEMLPDAIADGLEAALVESEDAALAYFLGNVVGLPEETIAGARQTDMWESRKGTMPTLLRELRAANAHERDREGVGRLRMPVRFVVGSESTEQMRRAIDAVHADMPGSELVVVDGRLFTTMYSDPEAAARQVGDFLLEHAD